MMLPRRRFLHLATYAAALPALARTSRAQGYPARPVRWIVPFAAGGSYDIIARVSGQWLSARFGQQFVIEARPGGSSNIGTEAVVRAAPDGYTLLFASLTNAVNESLYPKLSYSFARDIAPVAAIADVPNIMTVNPSLPVTTVPAFIAYAKAHNGPLSIGSGGVGTPGHMSAELFKIMTGTDLLHVPYRGGGPATLDLLGGQLQVMFGTLPQSIEHVRAGSLRALAVTTAKRLSALPHVPALNEFVPGYQTGGWTGIGAPRDTPAEIIESLNGAINAMLADRTVVARFEELGLTPMPGSAADFAKLIGDDTEKWRRVIAAGNIKIE
jgi:tripartite-type tricarboxylate transporter receptor subunit TctC